MLSCFPTDRPTLALHLSLRTLVDSLLCYPSEVLQLRFVYILQLRFGYMLQLWFVYIKFGRMSLAHRDSSVFHEAVHTRSLLA